MTESGFEIVEGVLEPEECDALAAALPPGTRGRAGARHLMSHPAVRRLAESDRLLPIAGRHAGLGAIPYRATLFEKSGLRNWLVVWHQDTTLPLASRTENSDWGPWSVKDGILYAHAPARALAGIVALRIHLDASTPENGPLRVIPGTHTEGVLTDEQVFRRAHDRPSVDCLVGRGGVLAMHPLLLHASSKARGPEPRRVLHVEYAVSLDVGDGLRLKKA